MSSTSPWTTSPATHWAGSTSTRSTSPTCAWYLELDVPLDMHLCAFRRLRNAPGPSTLCKASCASVAPVSTRPNPSASSHTPPPVRLSRAHAKDRAREKADLVLFANPRTKEERQRDNIVIDQFNSQWAAVDPKNTKVFVGGISPRVFLHEVVSRFAKFGTLTNVSVHIMSHYQLTQSLAGQLWQRLRLHLLRSQV
jgi:hypothetical protein